MNSVLRFVQVLSVLAVLYSALIVLNVFFKMLPLLAESVARGELMPLASLLITLSIAAYRFMRTL